jgi:hypothetical protein
MNPYGNHVLPHAQAHFDSQPEQHGAQTNTSTTNYYFVNVTAPTWVEQPRSERVASEDCRR